MPASDHKRRLTAFVVAMAVLIATPLAVVATDAFTDVSASSVHHDNITWLKDAGVTSGCNPPDNDEYCPTENVTRAQMATFMRNLATNQVVDAATAVDSEQLGGAAPDAYTTRVWAASCGIEVIAGTAETTCLPSSGGVLPPLTAVEVFSLQVDAPTGGALQLSSTSVASEMSAWSFTLDQTCSSDAVTFVNRSVNGQPWASASGNFTGTAHFTTNVDAGQHTLRLCALDTSDAPNEVAAASLSAQWTAGGSVSVTGSDSSPVEMPGLLGN